MSLNIKIGDNYTITNDKYQYMLNKVYNRKSKKTGEVEPVAVPIGYYGLHSFNLLKDHLIKDIALNSAEITTVTQLNKVLTDAKAFVEDALVGEE